MNYLNKVIISLNNSNVKWYIPKCGFFASFEIKNSINTENFIKRLYMQDILIGGMSRYYLKNNTNNKFMRISISSVNNDKIAKGISIMMNETKY